MKRRGFLGFLGGAAIAGPSMAKQAVAATVADLNLAGLSGGIPVPDYDGPVGQAIGGSGAKEWAVARLAKLAIRTAEQHDYHRRSVRPNMLDPDIASYRSIALHQKIRMQRDRDYVRGLEQERASLQGAIAGWFDDGHG